MKKISIFIMAVGLGLLISCSQWLPSKVYPTIFVDSVVKANVETDPVPANIGDDSADDPAVFVHPEDPAKSLIIGTNKKDGLAVYNLQGKQINYQSVGLINNVDLRQGFKLGNETITVVAASNRTYNSLLLMRLHEDGTLTELQDAPLVCPVDEVYGVGMYISPKTGNYFAFINGKDGQILQYLLQDKHGKFAAELVSTRKLASQPEGIVADDELGWLYVGEEKRGLWKFNAEPNSGNAPTLVGGSSRKNAAIKYDVEGVSIYYAAEGKGYIILSSQGNFSYAVFERQGDNKYLGSFRIQAGVLDGVEETDGLDVINLALNEEFSSGMLIVQDGYNYEGDEVRNQNFKFVAWERIARLANPPLIIDPTYRVNR